MEIGRVWVDVLTPKQVLFFSPIVDALKAEGCDVLATSRRYREVGPLAEARELALRYVGERGGKDPEGQLVAATQRQAEVIPLVKGFGPNVSVSVASGVCARVSFGLGVKHVAVNDSPHSEVADRLSLPLSHHLLCPWVIPYGAWAMYGVFRPNITRYRALDPAVWLKRRAVGGPTPDLEPKRKTIVVRLEESYAPYMAGKDASLNDAVLQSVSDAFTGENLVALCRYGDQLEHVREKFGSRYLVPDFVDGRALLEKTDVFVGLGGTMTAESALMGVPTISMFQGFLYTEDYLKSVSLLTRTTKPAQLVRRAARLLDSRFKRECSKKAGRVLRSMEDPVPVITHRIISTAKQG